MPMAVSSTARLFSIIAITSLKCFSRYAAEFTDNVLSSTGAPSDITINILLASGRAIILL